MFHPNRRELRQALESLCSDQLKPVSRTLRRRIGEQASGLTMEQLYCAPDGEFKHLPHIDLVHLQSLCSGCSCIQVHMEEGGDWLAVFNDRPQTFVDIYSRRDPFSDGFWQKAREYFEEMSGSNMLLPGNRYACAQALVCRKPKFLSNYTLGQACHMVEIAISRRKLLGYRGNAIVPYGHSLLMRKEQCATQHRCFNLVAAGGIDVDGGCQASSVLPAATLEIARRILREILQSNTVIPLSNIKRIFRNHYQTELSETLLGHSRLSDLLQDMRFRDLCTVQLQRNGYIVVAETCLQEEAMLPTGLQGSGCSEEAPRLELAALLPTPVPSPVAALPTPLPSPGVPSSARVRKWSTWHSNSQNEATTSYYKQQLGLEESFSGRQVTSITGHTPQYQLHYGRDDCFGLSLEPATGAAVAAGPVTISLSLASSMPSMPSPGALTSATQRGCSDQPCRTQFCKDEPLCLVPTPLASPGVPGSAVTRKWAELQQQSSLTRSDSSDSTATGNTLVSMLSFPWEPSGPFDNIGWKASIDSLPLVGGSTQLLHAKENSAPFAESGEQLCDEQALVTPRWESQIADVTNQKMTSETCFPRKISMPSLSLRQWNETLVAHNTFIHAEMSPQSPVEHRHRSSSVPKDTGSSMEDPSIVFSDFRASQQQSNSGRWTPKMYRTAIGDVAISSGQDEVGLGLHPCFSPQLGSTSRSLELEDLLPQKEMVSPKVPFDLQPTFLSAQAGRLGLSMQKTSVHPAPVPLAPSIDKETRSSSAPPTVCRTAASGCCFEDMAWPLDLVSSVDRKHPPKGREVCSRAEEEEAMAVEDPATTTHAIGDDVAAAKAESDAPRPPPQRRMRMVRSAKLLEMMPPCCRTFFHSATAPESSLRAA